MRKFQMIGLALMAVFAFSAVMVANASAAEWLCKEGGTFKACPKVTGVDSEATLTLSDATLLGTITIECSGTDTGTVGIGAADTTTKILDLAKATTDILCKVTGGSALCGSAEALAEAINLPWKTELLSTTIDDLSSSGAGNPGWHVVCSTGTEDECTKALAELTIKNETNGTVDALFNVAENATCLNGNGKVSGLVLLLAATKGVEGIAVS